MSEEKQICQRNGKKYYYQHLTSVLTIGYILIARKCHEKCPISARFWSQNYDQKVSVVKVNQNSWKIAISTSYVQIPYFDWLSENLTKMPTKKN